jgi:hypothetical protein
LIERRKVIEPEEMVSARYADIYIKIEDKILYQIAVKELLFEEALHCNKFNVYGCNEVWCHLREGIKRFLARETFKKIELPKSEDVLIDEFFDGGSCANGSSCLHKINDSNNNNDDDCNKETEVIENHDVQEKDFFEGCERVDLSTVPPEFKFLVDAFIKVCRKEEPKN